MDMENKSLQIEQAVQGESLATKTLASYQEFHNELKIYNEVDDVFSDSRVKIKKDQGKYIFNINGANKFNVDTPVLEEWLNKFYDDKKIADQWKAEEEAHIRIEGLEITYLKSRTQEELNDLQYEINQTNTRIEHATNIESTKYKVERLITFFEQEKDLTNESIGRFGGRSYDRKDRGLWKINKTEIKRRIIELKKIKKQIEQLEKNQDKKYTIQRDANGELQEVKMDDINGFDRETTLLQFNQRIEELGEEAPEFIKTRNEIILENGDTTPYYEIILNNTKDASELKLALQNINNDYITLNKMSLSVDKRQALQQDLKRLQEYLEEYENNPNKPLEPFVPESGDSFTQLMNTEAWLQRFITLNKKTGKTQNTDQTENPSGYPRYEEIPGGTGENNNNQNNQGTEYTPSPYNSAGEAFEKGGVSGIMNYYIDQTHMKPNQKQFWGGVGNLAMTGGMIFVGWKMLSSAFKLVFKKDARKDSANRAWLLGPTALIFGSQARSGEGPMSLFKGGALTEKIAGIWGGGAKNTTETGTETMTPQEQETQIKYAEGFPGATALFNGLTYGEMKQFLIQEGNTTKINPAQYDTLLDMFKTGSKKNEAAAAFLESIGKNDQKNVIDLALTGMGISREALQNTPDKKFDNAAMPAIARLRSVSEYMDQHGYNAINSETQGFIDKYIANGKDIDELDELVKRGDVFYKTLEITDQTGLEATITTLANGDIQKKQELLLAINSFWETMPNASRKIDIIGTGDEVQFKTYDQTSTINIKNKELVGFTPSRFDSYLETFKAANLTNRIKDICKTRTARKENPFYLSTYGGDIQFDDAALFSTQFDTEIMTASRGGELKNVSPTLEANRQAYCDYLNRLKFWKQ